MLDGTAPVRVALVGWYSSALVAVLPIAIDDDGMVTGYLRVAGDQDSVLCSEAGRIHGDHLDLAYAVPLDATWDEACGTWELDEPGWERWLGDHRGCLR